MKKTCLLLSIGCVSLMGFSARSAQAQTAPEAPSVMPTATMLPESAAVPPTAQTAPTRQPVQTVAQREPGTSIAAPVAVQPAPKSSSFVRVPMVSRIFPAMWQ